MAATDTTDELLYYHEQRNLLSTLTALIDEASYLCETSTKDTDFLTQLSTIFEAQRDVTAQLVNWQNIQETAGGHLTRANLYETRRLDSYLNKFADRLATQLGVQINVKCRAITLCTDYDKLNVVLENLIGNAVKYSNRQPVMIQVERMPYRMIELRVIDRGCGIKPADLRRVGEPRFRACNATKIAAGTGLGVYFSKKLLQQLGFSLSYTSSEAGTTAIIKI